jgi:hypothetical protein
MSDRLHVAAAKKMSFKRAAIGCLSEALLRHDWTIEQKGNSGIDACKKIDNGVQHVLVLAIVKDAREIVFFQPSLGIRIEAINRISDQLLGEGMSYAQNPITCLVVLNHLLSNRNLPRPEWTLSVSESLQADATCLVESVLKAADESGFYRAIRSTTDVISAYESAAWPIVSGRAPYLAALVQVGRVEDAKKIALQCQSDYFSTVESIGATPRREDYVLYENILKLPRN